MHLVRFTTEIYYDARPCERQINRLILLTEIVALCCQHLKKHTQTHSVGNNGVFVDVNVRDSYTYQCHSKV